MGYKLNEQRKYFHTSLSICIDILGATYCYRTIQSEKPKNQFFKRVANSFYDSSILKWCQIFGTDNESYHWKTLTKIISNEHYGLISNYFNKHTSKCDIEEYIRGKICSEIDNKEFERVGEELRNYRNKVIVHPFLTEKQYPKVSSYPTLDLIRSTTVNYYNFIHGLSKKLNEKTEIRIELQGSKGGITLEQSDSEFASVFEDIKII